MRSRLAVKRDAVIALSEDLGLNPRLKSLMDAWKQKQLENEDLKFSVDYRSLYATVGQRWWGLNKEFIDGGPYPIIGFI